MSSLSDTGKKSVIILSVLTALSTLFVFLRLWKRKGVHNIGVDDGLLIFALVMIYAQDAGAFLRKCERVISVFKVSNNFLQLQSKAEKGNLLRR